MRRDTLVLSVKFNIGGGLAYWIRLTKGLGELNCHSDNLTRVLGHRLE